MQQQQHIKTEPFTQLDEQILVVPRSKLFKDTAWHGLSTDSVDSYIDIIRTNQLYLPRSLMEQDPSAFYPPPKIYSRLLYFKPKQDVKEIPDEQGFWKFIKLIFHQPRRTMRNNLMQTHYDISKFPQELLHLRAQQLGMRDFLAMWIIIKENEL